MRCSSLAVWIKRDGYVSVLTNTLALCRYGTMASWYGNAFHTTGCLWGESIGHRWFPSQRAGDALLWCFFSLKCLFDKQSNCWWFETPWRPREVTLVGAIRSKSMGSLRPFIMQTNNDRCFIFEFSYFIPVYCVPNKCNWGNKILLA